MTIIEWAVGHPWTAALAALCIVAVVVIYALIGVLAGIGARDE